MFGGREIKVDEAVLPGGAVLGQHFVADHQPPPQLRVDVHVLADDARYALVGEKGVPQADAAIVARGEQLVELGFRVGGVTEVLEALGVLAGESAQVVLGQRENAAFPRPSLLDVLAIRN